MPTPRMRAKTGRLRDHDGLRPLQCRMSPREGSELCMSGYGSPARPNLPLYYTRSARCLSEETAGLTTASVQGREIRMGLARCISDGASNVCPGWNRPSNSAECYVSHRRRITQPFTSPKPKLALATTLISFSIVSCTMLDAKGSRPGCRSSQFNEP